MCRREAQIEEKLKAVSLVPCPQAHQWECQVGSLRCSFAAATPTSFVKPNPWYVTLWHCCSLHPSTADCLGWQRAADVGAATEHPRVPARGSDTVAVMKLELLFIPN